ncbi:RtcB family protein [Oleidesulfovibrio sp.]|uniref:RtcB family protein n=1 Tax=Oleidesulfovibrio sp. TaxID=2909707 RepID=UPI003A8514D6
MGNTITPVQKSESVWKIYPSGKMRVPALIFASRRLVESMDQTTLQQLVNIASLPGITGPAIAMSDAHSGYGFPIGGVAGFSADDGGIISAGGVGYDIACGVRTLTTNLTVKDIASHKRTQQLADALFKAIPAGTGKGGIHNLTIKDIDNILLNGAVWAAEQGMGTRSDLERTEDGGKAGGADPRKVSAEAKSRFINQLGTLGSGNHYLEVQVVDTIFNKDIADQFNLHKGQILVSIHCGSRGLGHQVATDYILLMKKHAAQTGQHLPDPALACAPIQSELGQDYLAAMRAGINCALANRQALTHSIRNAFTSAMSDSMLTQLYDVSHNTCKEERHIIDGSEKRLFVHRKGATRSFGPNHPDIPADFKTTGQPVLVGGSMGTASWILAGSQHAEQSLYSANHGAGRQLSRTQAKKRHNSKELLARLQKQSIEIRTSDLKALAEEAPAAYKDVDEVIESTCTAGLAVQVARLKPLICIKG